MNKREKFLKEIAEVINRNSLEAHFNDTPDYILAKVAVEAMENFAEASARRDNWHGFKKADKPGEVVRNEDCGNCPDIIPNMPTGCAPDNRRPEKICGTCRYFNPEFPVNGKPAPVCLAIKEMKGGTEYSNPRGTQHYFRCSNGRYEIGISN